MDLQLASRTCLVTGASAGIGRATAAFLAAEGAQVVATARSVDRLSELAAEIAAAGGRPPILLAADFARPESTRELADQVKAAVGRVDVLVNNAGGSRPVARYDDEAAWEESFLINFLTARRLTEYLVPAMLENGWGRIINVTGAVVAKAANAAMPAKAALESWSKSSAALYAARGVTVNCVAPGRINSVQILTKLYPTEASRQKFIDENIPLGRFGEPREAAALIGFLASGSASFINGVTIPMDGGAQRFTL